ncbi:Iron(III) dicitrate-binding protein [Methanosarcina siciliae C2J]|uniref:Iron(III) dicitrate-binding protein n=1 Tax=Methanosarcina siciliae C2J TaxID=1434118 RepID=A0A0E3PN47_9EURY|nr:Iron(III) dicitrate-binding protein [Methanosarcina siciliae C2J]
MLANAYFVGKVLYPALFEDINPEAKANEIYTFFVGKPVFSELNGQYGNLVFKQIPLCDGDIMECILPTEQFRKIT